jgi:hypothetical protein
MQTLNALLSCKQNLDEGKNINDSINFWLNQSNHPYLLYLKSLSEVQQGRHEESVFWAGEFLSEINHNIYYAQVYSNLLGKVKTIINPNYSLDDEGMLSVAEELSLGNFTLHQSQPFSITVANTGKSPLTIHDVRLSCTCVKMADKRNLTLQPGESGKIDFVFTADIKGNVMREITFFSNGINPMQTVRITARIN